ncbi:hypothetical protein VPH35_068211 [Triticum aestivum]
MAAYSARVFQIVIIISTSITMYIAEEKQLHNADLEASSGRRGCICGFGDFYKSLKNLPPSMFKVLAVTAVTWLAWFPFIQYGTDWMGKEIYHGEPQGPKVAVYYAGVREGAVGLLLSSMCLLAASFNTPHLCGRLTSRVVWSLSNFILFGIMTAMVILGLVSTKGYNASFTAGLSGPDPKLRVIALSLFALIGIPQAVLFSVPWAVASKVADDRGQGLAIGVLNIAIIVPQLIIVLTAGPIDKAFGKGNTPAFGVGCAFAFICAVLALILLPKTRGTRGTSNATAMASRER